MQRELKEFETIFCTTLIHLKTWMKSHLYFCPPSSQPPLPQGHLLGGFGESVCILLKDTHMCWPPLYFKHRCTPNTEKPGDAHTPPGWATGWTNTLYPQHSHYWRKTNFLFESLLPKFSIIPNKMNYWLEHIHCYHDKQCFAFILNTGTKQGCL